MPRVPITFPTHPAAILPLKLWRPRWFDGVALALGSLTPDLGYLPDGSGLPTWPFSHQPAGLAGWCLPLTLIGCPLVRRAAPVLAANLPAGGPFALRDYGALRVAGHAWWVTVLSALLGAASHLLLDAAEEVSPVLELAGYLVGVPVILALMLVIGRRRLIRAWHGPAPEPVRRPRLFWTVAALVPVPGIIATLLLPTYPWHTSGIRILTALAAGLLVAAFVVRRRPAPAG
jgi:Domain of unknown function (DUF4184)